MAIAPISASGIPLSQAQSGVQELGRAAAGGLELDKAQTTSFVDVFGDLLASANMQEHRADATAAALAEGRTDDIHGTMIEGQKAMIQTRLVGQIKNKVVDAFYELWRMNI